MWPVPSWRSSGWPASVFALIDEPRFGWTDPRVLVPLIGGLGLLAALVVWERRAREPMVPAGLFSKRNFAAGNLTTFALYGGLAVATFFLVVFIQQVGGYTPLQAGLALLPVTRSCSPCRGASACCRAGSDPGC